MLNPHTQRVLGKIMLRRLSLRHGDDGGAGSVAFVRRCLIKAAQAGTVNLDALYDASAGDFEHDLFVICGSMNLRTGRMPAGIVVRSAAASKVAA